MRTTFTIAAALLSMTAAGGASAADLGPYRPAPPPVEQGYAPAPFSWTGFYMGANVGYGWGAGDRVGITDFGAFQGNIGNLNTDGVFGGGQFGYNHQMGRFLVGIEADIQKSDLNDKVTGVTPTGYAGIASSDINYFGTIRGRLGFVSGPALFYATAGWAWADVDYKLTTLIPPGAGGGIVSLADTSFKSGYTVGGGIEYALGRNWTTKVEYQYVNFGGNWLAGAGIATKESLAAHTVRMGVNYKF